jgi:amino acid transporter
MSNPIRLPPGAGPESIARPEAAAPVRPLARGMGVLGVLFLTLSAETPASSVFVILPGVIQAAGSGALLAMTAAGLVALCMALTYAELGSTFPSAGGEYAIVGTVMGPVAGFAVLGVNLFNLLLSCAALSLGVADYLAAVVPHIAPVPTALVALALATGLGVLNIRTSAAATGAFLAVELLALVVVTGLGFAHPARPLSAVILHPVALGTNHGLAAMSLGGLATAVVVGLFAYDGYGNAVYLAEEVRDVRRRLVQAVLWALAATTVAEMAALAAVLTGAPDLKALFAAGDGMISDFTTQAGGAVLGRAIGAGVALAILNAVIALVVMTGRQIYATARDGVWPGAAARVLTQVHPKLGSPWAATLAAGALSAGLCFLPMSLLLTLSGSGVTLIYIALSVACLRHGRRGRDGAPGWRLPLWPGPPLLALALLVVFAASSLKDGAVSFAVSVASAAVAAAYYLFYLKRRPGWRLRGPSVEAPQPEG